MTRIYRLADTNIEVSSLYNDVHTLMRGYLTDSVPDFDIGTSDEDIVFEREKSEASGMGGMPDSYYETLAVLRKISERMPRYGSFLFHGSAIAVDGEAYIFTAASGVGKSTHARLWREYLKDRAFMVNDDKPFIRPGKTTLVYGSPWDGKHRLSRNVSVPVKAIALLGRADKNSVELISRSEALPVLIRQTYRPFDPKALEITLGLLYDLDVKFYRLYCNMEPDAAYVSYNAMKG